jgi:signal transduction histidine kinase
VEKAFHEQQAHDLAKLNADKDKFFSIVAHDLKGPFMPLLGYAEYLLEVDENYTPEEVKEIAKTIHDSAKNIFTLLENLLQWARLQMGRMEYQPGSITLRTVAQKTLQLLKPTADQKKITLNSTLDSQLVAKADEYMTYTVIRNLTNNALKFTPNGGQVTIIGREIDADYLEVAVIDTGVGIKPENIGKLFQIQSHFTTIGTAQEKGTGLGLIMCREMIEMNGGKIWVESELGQGTTVKFTLPRYHEEDEEFMP